MRDFNIGKVHTITFQNGSSVEAKFFKDDFGYYYKFGAPDKCGTTNKIYERMLEAIGATIEPKQEPLKITRDAFYKCLCDEMILLNKASYVRTTAGGIEPSILHELLEQVGERLWNRLKKQGEQCR